ncbi:hypothetical protein WDW86_15450 [Bdellovibrionota bacterium FG-2]
MNYHKQVIKAAHEVLSFVKGGYSLIACQASPQTGKTELIECAYELLQREFPDSLGLYVCAHNHLDFVDQNFPRLEHLESKDLYCLGLRQRRRSLVGKKPLSSFKNTPVVVFFDEDHFGDGSEQTIHSWLRTNNLCPGRKIFLIGVSATGFTIIKRAGKAVVRMQLSDMPIYKSITYMFEHGHIKNSTPMLVGHAEERRVDQSNEAFQQLNHLIKGGIGGYAIIRVNGKDAPILDAKLKRLHQNRVHVRHWNQANQISNPEAYFSQKRGVFVVVIVQQKARMGNTIPTQHLKLVYEHSPKPTVATVAQGLLGRCCGHGKLTHKVTVYSHRNHAEAYMLFETGYLDDFFTYLEAHGLRASQRAKLAATEMQSYEGKLPGYAGIQRSEIVESVLNDLRKRHGLTPPVVCAAVRRWTTNKNKEERHRYTQAIALGDNPTLTKPNREAGSLSIYLDNRKDRHHLYYAYRSNKVLVKADLVASDDSFYSEI